MSGCGRRCRSRFSRSATHGTWVGRRNPGPPCRCPPSPTAVHVASRSVASSSTFVASCAAASSSCGTAAAGSTAAGITMFCRRAPPSSRGAPPRASDRGPRAAVAVVSAPRRLPRLGVVLVADGLCRAAVVLHRIVATHTVAADVGLRGSRARLTSGCGAHARPQSWPHLRADIVVGRDKTAGSNAHAAPATAAVAAESTATGITMSRRRAPPRAARCLPRRAPAVLAQHVARSWPLTTREHHPWRLLAAEQP